MYIRHVVIHKLNENEHKLRWMTNYGIGARMIRSRRIGKPICKSVKVWFSRKLKNIVGTYTTSSSILSDMTQCKVEMAIWKKWHSMVWEENCVPPIDFWPTHTFSFPLLQFLPFPGKYEFDTIDRVVGVRKRMGRIHCESSVSVQQLSTLLDFPPSPNEQLTHHTVSGAELLTGQTPP